MAFPVSCGGNSLLCQVCQAFRHSFSFKLVAFRFSLKLVNLQDIENVTSVALTVWKAKG